jgi:hypothetical protein
MKSVYVGVIFSVIAVTFLALTTEFIGAPEAKPCTPAWFQYLDDHYVTVIGNLDDDDGGDGGREPDFGAREWIDMFAAMTKITLPNHLSDQQRCQFVQETLRQRIYIANRAFNGSLILKLRQD